MPMRQNKSIAVIGGGVIGINSAFQLQKRGFNVTVFEPNGVAMGASYGNAGHFATEQVFPLADPTLLKQLPKMLCDPLGPFRIKTSYLPKALPWFTRFMMQMSSTARERNTNAIIALNKLSIAAWQQVATEIKYEELVTIKGSLLTYEKIDDSHITQTLEQYKAKGVSVRFVDNEELKDLAPQLDKSIKGALYFDEVGHTCDPQQLSQAVSDLFVERGGVIANETVQHITDEFRPIVSTNLRDKSFDHVVICAGAYSKAFAKQLGYNVPLETERGYHLMLPLSVNFDRPIASHERKFIMTPMAHGLRLAGTVEFGGNDSKPNYQRSDMLLTHAKAMISEEQCPALHNLTLEELTESARWMGRRPSLPDSLPVIDKSPHNASVFFNFGHQHLGLTWGAICGELIGQLIAGEPPTIALSPYRISRF